MTKTPVLSFVALLALALPGAVPAQTRGDTVTWTVSAPPAEAKPGSRVTVTLQGAVQKGWHVYGLKQLPLGPTPLLVKLEASDVAKADGAPAGSPATKFHDPAFNLETQYYSEAFTVKLPVRVGSTAGRQSIPLSVRFQTCNGDICQPPKTVRLSAPITVRAG